MHVSHVRKHAPGLWRAINRLALSALIAAVTLLAISGTARGNTAVEYLEASQQPSYEASRVYAGRTLAGRASELGFKKGGQLAEITVDVGSTVQSGALIARLDTAGLEARLAQARAEVTLAAANLKALQAEAQLAEQTEARFRKLRPSGHVSAQAYDEQLLALQAKRAQLGVARAALQKAEAARSMAQIDLTEAHIYAPFGGTIQHRHLDEGSQAGSGQPVVRLVETSRSEAHIGIPERLATQLAPAAAFELAWADRRFPATLKTILPEVDPDTRTLTAVFELQLSSIPLGAVVELNVSSQIDEPGFWLPLTALTESDRGMWDVFVINPASQIERRLVEVIHIESERAYVRGTLQSGDRVVKTGVQRLVAGQQVAMISRG